MSQKEIINTIINKTLGWKFFDSEVLYVPHSQVGKLRIESGWYLKSDILCEDYYLGSNFSKALDTVVIEGHTLARVSSIMKHLKDKDSVRYENTCQMLNLVEPLEFLFPEFEQQDQEEVKVTYATMTERVTAFILGAGLVFGLGTVLFWSEIVTTVVGLFGYRH